MTELSLFTGCGGGVLASKLLSHRIVGYVEIEPYCQKIIRQRIKDEIFDDAPIFSDIREFNRDYASAYQGLVDVVSGGFPCQPFSVAGKRLGADDPRNMWPDTIETIRLVRPRFAFLENVPGLLASGYFGTILADLHASGYDAEWTVLGADDCGAPHRRKRLWILAYTACGENNGRSRGCLDTAPGCGECGDTAIIACREDVAHTHEAGRRELRGAITIPPEYSAAEYCGSWWDSDPADISDAMPQRRPPECGNGETADGKEFCVSCESGSNGFARWGLESGLGRVAHGVACRVDRLKAIGNGQVPVVAASAFRILRGRLRGRG